MMDLPDVFHREYVFRIDLDPQDIGWWESNLPTEYDNTWDLSYNWDVGHWVMVF